jgi:hypothetical protein
MVNTKSSLESMAVFLRLGGKTVLAYAAGGTNPNVGKIRKFGSRLNASVRIAFGGIVDITADFAHKFL